MKAVVLEAKNTLNVRDIPCPQPGKDEVLIKVAYCGVCGSDMPRVLGDAAHSYPIVLGHEFSGTVAAIGEGVNNCTVGEAVTAAPLIPCHTCPRCQRGWFAQCKTYSFVGSRQNGAWAEYVCVPSKNVVKLPEGISMKAGAFIEPASVGIHALDMMGFKPGVDTAITGLGTIGLLAMQSAKAMGAGRIFALDIDENCLARAKELGADVCINSGSPDCVDKVMELTEGEGIPMVLECAGAPPAEKLALRIAQSMGHVMLVGTPATPPTFDVPTFELIHRRELWVRGTWMSYEAPFPGSAWTKAARWLADGRIRTETLTDRIVSPEGMADAFAAIARKEVSGKVLLEVK